MASRALLRTLSAARITPLTITRTYVIPARTFTPRTFAPIKTQKASASTGTEHPEFIDTLPDTSKEVNVPPQLNGQGNGNGIGNENGNGLGVDLNGHQGTDWSKSYSGLSTQAFSKDIVEVLLAPIDPLDVEIKPGAFTSSLMFCIVFSSMFILFSFLAYINTKYFFHFRRLKLPARN
jgi:hypothetical protein